MRWLGVEAVQSGCPAFNLTVSLTSCKISSKTLNVSALQFSDLYEKEMTKSVYLSGRIVRIKILYLFI